MNTFKELMHALEQGQRFKYVYFWGHTPKHQGSVDASCFSQWFPAPFVVDGIEYPTAEHFMMVKKAELFGDSAIVEKMLSGTDPGKVKALGRQVSGFRDELWNQHRFEIVVQGNYAKFSQNAELKEFLLATKKRVLVEASPYDRVWGVGLDAGREEIQDPRQWRGENLLGFALMAVREQLLV